MWKSPSVSQISYRSAFPITFYHDVVGIQMDDAQFLLLIYTKQIKIPSHQHFGVT